ncbi:MAG: hypothetical protein KF789_11280, partial [Bdellovibrionaceae bacterium]|nr:hypothetical protein [Pseudobdellovibrionaceae bacterium]
ATTGTLLLEGEVQDATSIVIQPEASAHRSLDILAGESNRLVGNAVESSNNLAGYTVTARSASGGLLVHTTASSISTGYRLSYNGGTPLTLTTTDTVVKDVTSLSALTTATSAIRVDVTAFPTAPTGLYQDVVTFTIQAR